MKKHIVLLVLGSLFGSTCVSLLITMFLRISMSMFLFWAVEIWSPPPHPAQMPQHTGMNRTILYIFIPIIIKKK